MKSALTHRLSAALLAGLATATLATGTATADAANPEPVSEYGIGADLTALIMGLAMTPGSSALSTGSTQLSSGSGLSRLVMQMLCLAQYGTWDASTATCHYPVFHPGSRTVDITADASGS